MHPARARARQVEAIVETAASVSSLREQMDRIEATLAAILERLEAPAAEPARPTPTRKDK